MRGSGGVGVNLREGVDPIAELLGRMDGTFALFFAESDARVYRELAGEP